MIERRQYPRLNKSTIVRFRFPGSHLGMSSRSEDVSEGGIRVAVLQRLDLGMNLDLNFKLEDCADSITARAKIIWQDTRNNTYYPFAVGLKFLRIDSADSKKIRDYVNKILCKEKTADATGINH